MSNVINGSEFHFVSTTALIKISLCMNLFSPQALKHIVVDWQIFRLLLGCFACASSYFHIHADLLGMGLTVLNLGIDRKKNSLGLRSRYNLMHFFFIKESMTEIETRLRSFYLFLSKN